MFRNFRLGTIHVNIAVMIPSSESTDVIAFQFLNRRLASVSQINTFSVYISAAELIHAITFMDVILADCMLLHAFGPQN